VAESPAPPDDQPGEVPQKPAEKPAEKPAAEPAGELPELSEFAHPEIEIPERADAELRRYPSTIGGVLFLLALGGTLAGVGIMTTGKWRLGVLWMGASLLGAAAARLVLPENQAGMLHVRRRLVDVVLLVGLGVGLVVSAAAIPTR
jgi:hypothetical protein